MGFVHIACVFVHVCPKNDYDDECCWRMVWNVLQKALQVSLRSHRRCVVISMLGAAGEENRPQLQSGVQDYVYLSTSQITSKNFRTSKQKSFGSHPKPKVIFAHEPSDIKGPHNDWVCCFDVF